MKQKTTNYDVGYGRPPKHSRFQKGTSGNPSGRPKSKAVDLNVFWSVYGRTVTVTMNGRRRRMTVLEAIFVQNSNQALNGDIAAFRQTVACLKLLGLDARPKSGNEQLEGLFAALKAGPADK